MNTSRQTNTLLSPCEKVRKLGIPNSEGRGWRKALGYSPAFQMRAAPYRRNRDVCLGWLWNVQYRKVVGAPTFGTAQSLAVSRADFEGADFSWSRDLLTSQAKTPPGKRQ